MAGTPITPGANLAKFPGKATDEGFFNGAFASENIVRDPFVTGFAFIKWLTLPKWVESYLGNGVLQALTEKNLRAFQGIQDLEMSLMTTQEGFTPSDIQWAGTISKPTGFSMTHREFSGSPIRRAIQYWVTGIRDPRTGIATYPQTADVEYSAANHTGELMYIVTRPDANNAAKNPIEFACLFTMVMPVRIPQNHLNFQAGQQDGAELEIQFTGIPHTSAAVDELAQTQLANIYPFVSDGDWKPLT